MRHWFDEFSWRVLIACGLVAGVFNLLPYASGFPFGDVIQNYMFIRCFSEQIWSGHLYPRWCMGANLGLGSPAPIFYFPLPFYIASIFYPLKTFGLDIQGQYMLAVGLTNIVTFITCTYWLSRITSFRAALFCSFIFLWLPYRMEAQSGRSSYAELWCIAFLPLLFAEITTLADKKKAHWPSLALIITVCMLCHAPVTFIALMACGIMVLIYHRANPRVLATLFFCSLLAFCATLFHWQAASLLADSLNDKLGSVAHWRTSWLNSYLDNANNIKDRLLNIVMAILSGLAIAALALICYRGRAHITSQPHYRLLLGWLAVGLFALVMCFSISDPLWQLIERFTQVKTPYRMQILIVFAGLFFLAVGMRYVPMIKNRKIGDAAIAAMLVVLVGVATTSEVNEEGKETLNEILNAEIIFGYFGTRWMDEKINSGYSLKEYHKLFADAEKQGGAALLSTHGTTKVTGWGYDGIKVDAALSKADTLVVNQFYFPAWRASINGKPAALVPEKKLGRITLPLPKDARQIEITYDIRQALPDNFRYIILLSIAAWLIICLGFIRYIAFDKLKHAQ